MVSEYSDNTTTDQQLLLKGKEQSFKVPFGNTPGKITARLSANNDTLLIDSKVEVNFGGRNNEWATNEAWYLSADGNVLTVKQSFNSFMEKTTQLIVYKKE